MSSIFIRVKYLQLQTISQKFHILINLIADVYLFACLWKSKVTYICYLYSIATKGIRIISNMSCDCEIFFVETVYDYDNAVAHYLNLGSGANIFNLTMILFIKFLKNCFSNLCLFIYFGSFKCFLNRLSNFAEH